MGSPEKPPPAAKAKRLRLWLALAAASVAGVFYCLALTLVGNGEESRAPNPTYAYRYDASPLTVADQDVPGWSSQPTAAKERVDDDPTVEAGDPSLLSPPMPPRAPPPKGPRPDSNPTWGVTPRPGPIRIRAVDCTLSATLWTGAMERKLSHYMQQLTGRWGDEPKVRRELNKDFRAHQNKLSNSDGTQGTCEKISRDLDDWLRQWQHLADEN